MPGDQVIIEIIAIIALMANSNCRKDCPTANRAYHSYSCVIDSSLDPHFKDKLWKRSTLKITRMFKIFSLKGSCDTLRNLEQNIYSEKYYVLLQIEIRCPMFLYRLFDPVKIKNISQTDECAQSVQNLSVDTPVDIVYLLSL